MDERLQVEISAQNNLAAGLGSATSSLSQFGTGASSSLTAVTAASDAFVKSIGEGVKQIAVMALGLMGLEASARTLKEALNFADQIRDVEASLRTLSSSFEAGDAVFKRFRDSADATRNTTLELASAWREALPAAMRRGISDQMLGEITVQLAKLAPLIGQGLDQTMQQWEQIMAGRVRKTSVLANLLLGGTGYTIEDLIKGGKADAIFGAMLGNMDALATKGEALGQTFESAGKKIKDSFFEAFAKGFTGTDSVGAVWDKMFKQLTDPALLTAITNIGEAFKAILPGIIAAAGVVGKIVSAIAAAGGGAGAIWNWMTSPLSGADAQLTGASLRGLPFAGGAPPTGGYGISGSWGTPLPKGLNEFGTGVGGNPLGDYLVAVQKMESEFRIKSPDVLVNQLTASFDKQDAAIADLTAKYAALSEAEKQEIKPLADVLTLTNALAEAERQALQENAIVKYWEKADQALDGYLQKLADAQERMEEQFRGLALGPQAFPQINALFAAAVNPVPIPEMPSAADFTEALKQLGLKGKELYDNVRLASDYFKQHVLDPLLGAQNLFSNFFTDLATTGGKNAGQIFGSFFASEMQRAGKDLGTSVFDSILGITNLGGGKYQIGVDAKGQPIGGTREQAVAATPGAQQAAGYVSGITTAIAGIYKSATQHETDLANVVSSLNLSYQVYQTTGSWVLGVIALAASGIAHILQAPVGKDYPYATFGVGAGGAAFFTPEQNITKTQAAQALAGIQAAADQFYDSYVKLLLKLPLNFQTILTGAAAILAEPILPVVGLPGGDVGHAASQSFMTYLDAWIQTGLPKEIAAKFETMLKPGYVALGLSAEKFDTLWASIQKLDPTKGVALLNMLADGMTLIKDALTYFSQPFMPGRTNTGDWQTGMWNVADVVRNQSFADSLKEADNQILKLEGSLAFLSTEGQITTLKQIGDLMAQREQQVKAFIQSIYDAMKTFEESTTARMDQYRIATMVTSTGAPDIAAQIAYYKNQADYYLGLIHGTVDPSQALKYGNLAQDYINKVFSLGGGTPDFANWAIKNTQMVDDIVQKQLKKIGDDFAKANQDFINKFKPVYDDWANKLASSGNSVVNFSDALDGATGAVDHFTHALQNFTAGASAGAVSQASLFVGTTQSRRVMAGAA